MTWDRITRRDALRGVLGGAGATLAAGSPAARAAAVPDDVTFAHGIASGDPQTDAVVIWTRTTSAHADPVPLAWAVAEDEAFTRIVAEGEVTARPAADYTAKVDVRGLAPGTVYFYRFAAGDTLSPVGRTKTLPEGSVASAKLAVISCAHYAWGYYHVYRELSKIEDLDAIVHLGDYIYESSREGYGGESGKALGREHEPAHEIVTLSDYRTRYAQYRTDPDLQAAHAAVPFIPVWDDHETANNSWKDGAGNHQPAQEGPWDLRRNAALRAYFEWLPVRDPAPGQPPFRFYRTFRWGDLVSLHMLETRLTARDRAPEYDDMTYVETAYSMIAPGGPQPVDDPDMIRRLGPAAVSYVRTPFDMRTQPPTPELDYATASTWALKELPEGYAYLPDTARFRSEVIGDPRRRMLGEEQEAWLREELTAAREANVAWQVLGNQVVMARMDAPDYTKAFPAELVKDVNAWTRKWIDRTALGLPINLDAWDGYPAARDRVYEVAKDTEANLVVVTGDTHHFWANELYDKPDGPDGGGNLVGVEFATSSVSSIGGYDYMGSDPQIFDIADATMMGEVPEIVYAETRHRGWILLEIEPEVLHASYMAVSTVMAPAYDVIPLRRFRVTHKGPGQVSRLETV